MRRRTREGGVANVRPSIGGLAVRDVLDRDHVLQLGASVVVGEAGIARAKRCEMRPASWIP
jgi:hypothetical protein